MRYKYRYTCEATFETTEPINDLPEMYFKKIYPDTLNTSIKFECLEAPPIEIHSINLSGDKLSDSLL